MDTKKIVIKKHDTKLHRDCRRYSLLVGAIALIAGVVGIGYVVHQVFTPPYDVKDPFFVGFLMANSLIMWTVVKYFLSRMINYYEDVHADTAREAECQVLKTQYKLIRKPMRGLFIGICYALPYIFFVFFLAGLDSEPLPTKIFLAAFLGLSNVVTGMSLYLLYYFIKVCVCISPYISVKLWDKACKGSVFVTENSRRLAVIVAVISVFAVSSILVSRFDSLNTSTAIFSFWSLFVAFAAYAFPMLPLSRRLARMKKRTLLELEDDMQHEFDSVRRRIRSREKNIDSERIELIHGLISKVHKIRVFPPVGAKPIETAMLVTVLTFLPLIVETLLTVFTP